MDEDEGEAHDELAKRIREAESAVERAHQWLANLADFMSEAEASETRVVGVLGLLADAERNLRWQIDYANEVTQGIRALSESVAGELAELRQAASLTRARPVTTVSTANLLRASDEEVWRDKIDELQFSFDDLASRPPFSRQRMRLSLSAALLGVLAVFWSFVSGVEGSAIRVFTTALAVALVGAFAWHLVDTRRMSRSVVRLSKLVREVADASLERSTVGAMRVNTERALSAIRTPFYYLEYTDQQRLLPAASRQEWKAEIERIADSIASGASDHV